MRSSHAAGVTVRTALGYVRKGVGENVNYTDARPIRIRFDLNFEGFRAKLQSTSISTFKNNGLVDLSCHEEGIGSQGFRGVSLIIRTYRKSMQSFTIIVCPVLFSIFHILEV